jgi:cytochrome P450
MLDLFSADNRRNPYPVYEQIRAASPVFHDPESDAWMLYDYESVRRALTDAETFSSEVSPPPSRTYEWMVFADPPRHSKLRGLILRAFTPRAVAALEPRIRELSGQLLTACVGRGEIELCSDFAVPLPLMVIAELLGAPPADLPRFRRWSDVILELSYTLGGPPERAERAVLAFSVVSDEMERYVDELLEQRRARPLDDLLSGLVAAEVDGERLTNREILGFFQLLLVAGHETTTNLINNAVLCFLEHPEQLARVREQPRLLEPAIEEVLRFRSPVQAMFRVTRQAVELRGQRIPAGRLVMPWIGSANRDPAQFADPDRFDVTRTPNAHIAFGHGIHFCLGAALSRLEARIALGDLLQRLPDLAFAEEGDWQPRAPLHVHGPARLLLRFTPP